MSIQIDLRNFLTTTSEVIELVAEGKIGHDDYMPEGYVFTDKPYTTVENLSHTAILVISSFSSAEAPRPGSGFDHKTVQVDIWASPSRDINGDVQEYDADDLIEEIYKKIRSYIHTVNSQTAYKIWNGTHIVSSEITEGPNYRDVKDGNGARMARITLEVTL